MSALGGPGVSGATSAAPRWRDLWPRRASGLPPGQGRLEVFPRFGVDAGRPPPTVPTEVELTVRGDGFETFSLALAELLVVPEVERVHDFHCVATWSRCDLRWTGIPMATIWERLIAPRVPSPYRLRYAVARGGDRYRAVLRIDDLLDPSVLLATALDGAPLDRRHGAPLRLVSPAQYGYKNVKHLVSIELTESEPASILGAMEHLRARVALEERHRTLPGPLLRLAYRSTVPIIAMRAERSAADAG